MLESAIYMANASIEKLGNPRIKVHWLPACFRDDSLVRSYVCSLWTPDQLGGAFTCETKLEFLSAFQSYRYSELPQMPAILPSLSAYDAEK